MAVRMQKTRCVQLILRISYPSQSFHSQPDAAQRHSPGVLAHTFLLGFGRVARCGPRGRSTRECASCARLTREWRWRARACGIFCACRHNTFERMPFSLMICRLTVWVCSVERGHALSNRAGERMELIVCNARASTGMRITMGFMVDGQVRNPHLETPFPDVNSENSRVSHRACALPRPSPPHRATLWPMAWVG